jgi:hypothetical protein
MLHWAVVTWNVWYMPILSYAAGSCCIKRGVQHPGSGSIRLMCMPFLGTPVELLLQLITEPCLVGGVEADRSAAAVVVIVLKSAAVKHNVLRSAAVLLARHLGLGGACSKVVQRAGKHSENNAVLPFLPFKVCSYLCRGAPGSGDGAQSAAFCPRAYHRWLQVPLAPPQEC